MKKISKALITGATSGIGKSLAYLLAARGVELIIVGRNEIALYGLTKELSSQVLVHPLRKNLACKEDLDELLSLISSHVPDLVVNNAGFGIYGDFMGHPYEEFDEMIALHCASLTAITHQAAEALVQQKQSGTIINISSVLGLFPCPGHAVYGATKAFVTHLSKALDYELQPLGVRVLVSCPGSVVTPFRSRASRGKLQAEKGLFSLNPDKVAYSILQQVLHGKRCSIIDFRYRVLSWLFRVLPERIVNTILYGVNKSGERKE